MSSGAYDRRICSPSSTIRSQCCSFRTVRPEVSKAGARLRYLSPNGFLIVFCLKRTALDQVVQVAQFQRGQQQPVVTVARVGAQPGVESVEVAVALHEVRRQAAEQLRPDDCLLQHVQPGDARRAVGGGGGLRPQAGVGVARAAGNAAQVLAQLGRHRQVERRVGLSGAQHEGVQAGVEHLRRHEKLAAVDGGCVAHEHEGDGAAVGVQAVAQDVAGHRMAFDRLDDERVLGEVAHHAEPGLRQQGVALRERQVELLVEGVVLDIEVRLQCVDGFETHAGDAGEVERRGPVRPRQVGDQCAVERLELEGVTVGFGPTQRPRRVVNVKAALDEGVGHRALRHESAPERRMHRVECSCSR